MGYNNRIIVLFLKKLLLTSLEYTVRVWLLRTTLVGIFAPLKFPSVSRRAKSPSFNTHFY